MIYAAHMSPDDVAIILCCMEEVNITDQKDRQLRLRLTMTRWLKKKTGEFYEDLVKLEKISSVEEIEDDIYAPVAP